MHWTEHNKLDKHLHSSALSIVTTLQSFMSRYQAPISITQFFYIFLVFLPL